MTSIAKARKFISVAKANEWTGAWETDPETDYAKVTCKRKSEVIEISWINNQLVGPPKYTFAGIDSNLHCAATARRTLEGQPDLEQHMKRHKRKARAAKVAQKNSSEGVDPLDESQWAELPFDIELSPDPVILKACRGSTIVWLNKLSGSLEMAYIPVDKNRDLINKFFVAESSSGRGYLSFVDGNGTFRAVALDAIKQVR